MAFPEKVHASFVAVLAVGLLSSSLAAQTGGPAPLAVHSLKSNLYWIEGGGGNSGVVAGRDGVVVIDAKISASSAKELLEDVAKITPKPVDTVILTHSDRDHVNGLAAFPTSVKVIAHENDKKEQEQAIAAGGKDAPPSDHLPTQVITKNKEILKVDGTKFELLHHGPAHTNGDLVIYLPSEKVVFTGDLITNRPDPLIHLEKNGSSEGWIKAAKDIVALDADTFIPGHGTPETKADVEKYITHAEQKRAQIKALIEQGKTLDEIKTAVGDAPPSGNAPSFATFTEVVYRELARH